LKTPNRGCEGEYTDDSRDHQQNNGEVQESLPVLTGELSEDSRRLFHEIPWEKICTPAQHVSPTTDASEASCTVTSSQEVM